MQSALGSEFASCSSFDAFGFEIRLDDTPDFDFGAAIRPGGSLPSSALFDSEVWRRVRELRDRWSNPGTVESDAISHAFLEFDVSRGLEQISSPAVFLGIKPTSQFSCGGGRYAPHPAAGSLSIVPRLIEGLLAHPIDTCTQEKLSDCISALPTGSILLHVGLMLSRSRAVRVHVAVPSHVASGYLDAIGLDSLAGEIKDLLSRYGAGAPLATLQMEIGEQVGEAIGIEFSLGSGLDEKQALAWSGLLNRLTEDGLCRSDKRDALLAWPSVFLAVTEPDDPLRNIRQDLSHVKISVRPDQPLRAKAYLSVVPSFSLFGIG